MNKIRVLHVYKTAYPRSYGGVEAVIHQLCTGYHPNFEAQVLTLGEEDQTVYHDGIKITQCKQLFEIASTGFSKSFISNLRRLSKEVDIIHYHFPWPFMDLAHILSGVKNKTVVTYHSDIVRQKNLLRLYQPLMKHFLGSANRIVATSNNYIRTSPILQAHLNKVSSIAIGLDDDHYPKDSTSTCLNINLPDKYFLFVGMLRYYKGLTYLLQAVALSQYPIVIAGGGPQELELKQQVEELGISSLVIFTGFVTDEVKCKLLANAYSFVFPSHLRSEAFGVSLLEAALYGKPLISCEIGTGTSYINQDLETGFVVEPENPEALATAMKRLWENESLAETMGVAARRRYVSQFSAKQSRSAYEKIYMELMT